MTFLINPLAAFIMMASSPLAYQGDHFNLIPDISPVAALVVAAQAEKAPVEPVRIEKVTEQSLAAEEAEAIAAPRAEVLKEQPQVVLAQADEVEVDAAPEVEVQSEPAPVNTTAVSETERRAILKSAANSLAAAKTAKGRFMQVSPDSTVTEGDFAIRRPGRMRFDYDDPTPVLIVADGTTVAMEDSDLETVDRVPLGSTPLGIILNDKLDFDKDTRVTNVRRTDSNVAITVESRDPEAEGSVTLYFDLPSYQLLSWRALDANRQETLVVLEDMQTNVNVDPRLFRLEDPADKDEDER